MPDPSLAALLRDAWVQCLEQITNNLEGARAGDEEALHQLRIGIRRLRVVLWFSGKVKLAAPSKSVRAEIKRIWALLGEARDWDVFATQTWPAATMRQPRHAGGAFDNTIAKLRAASHAKVRRALNGKRFEAVMIALGPSGLQREEWQHLDSRSAKVIRNWLTKRASKVIKHGAHVERLDSDQLHALRIDVKSLRYLSEFLSPLYSRRRSRDYVETVAAVQRLLGNLNDIATSRRLARQAMSRSHAKPCGAECDAFQHHGDVEEERLRRKLAAQWKAFRKSRPFWM